MVMKCQRLLLVPVEFLLNRELLNVIRDDLLDVVRLHPFSHYFPAK